MAAAFQSDTFQNDAFETSGATTFNRTATDTITTTESVSRAAATKSRTNSDTISTLTDALVKGIQTRSLTDTLTLSDSLTRVSNKARTTADTLTLTESIKLLSPRLSTDTLSTLTDSASRHMTMSRSMSDTVTISDGIVAASPPTASFTTNPIFVHAGQWISFTDTSSGTPTSWLWDFGDGTTSTQQNPVHQFSSEGTYNITLFVSNTAGNDTSAPSGFLVDPIPDQTIEIFYDGDDITDLVLFEKSQFVSQVNGTAGTCEIWYKDVDLTAEFVMGKTLDLWIDGLHLWSGFVKRIRRAFAFKDTAGTVIAPRYLVLDGSDVNLLFTKRVTFNQSDPTDVAGITYPKSPPTADTTAISDLVSDWLDLTGDGIDTTSLVENVGDINIDQEVNPFAAGWTWGDAMNTIKMLPGAIYYMTPDRELVYTDDETVSAQFGLSDQPVGGEFGFRKMEILFDATDMVNEFLAWGAGFGTPRMVFSDAKDSASIADHGLWQDGAMHTGVYKQATIDRIADSVVFGSPEHHRGHKDDKVAVICTVNEAEFLPGDKVQVTSNVFGFSRVLPIRRMVITFPTTKHAFFELTLSHEPDEPWSFFDNPPFFFPPFPPFPTMDWPWPTPGNTAYCPTPSGLLTCAFSDDFERDSGQPNGAAYGWYQDGDGNFVDPDIIDGAALVEFFLRQDLKRPISGDREVVVALDLTAWGSSAIGSTFQISGRDGLIAFIDWDGSLSLNVSRWDGINVDGFGNTGSVSTDLLWGKIFVRVLDVLGVGAFMRIWSQSTPEPGTWDVTVSAPDGHQGVLFGVTLISEYALIEGWAINGAAGGPAAIFSGSDNVDDFGLRKTWPFADPMDGRSYAVAWGSDSVTRDNYANPGYSASMAWGEFTNYGPGYLNDVEETFASRDVSYNRFGELPLDIDEPSAIRVGGEVSVIVGGHVISGTTPSTPTDITVNLMTFDYGDDDPSGYSDWSISGTNEGSVAFSMAVDDTNTWEPFDFTSNGGLSLHHWQWGLEIADPEGTLHSLGPATGGFFLPTSASVATSLRDVFFEAEYGAPLGAPYFCVTGSTTGATGWTNWNDSLSLTGDELVLPEGYRSGSTLIYVNDSLQRVGIDYEETDPAGGLITFLNVPGGGDTILVGYMPWNVGLGSGYRVRQVRP